MRATGPASQSKVLLLGTAQGTLRRNPQRIEASPVLVKLKSLKTTGVGWIWCQDVDTADAKTRICTFSKPFRRGGTHRDSCVGMLSTRDMLQKPGHTRRVRSWSKPFV